MIAFGRRLLPLSLLLSLLVSPAFAIEAATATLRGWMDTPAHFEAMQAKVESAIARDEHMVELDSPGGLSMYGWVLGERLHAAGMKVRCVGWCASAAAQILFTSRGCIVAPTARVALHAPQIYLTGLSASAFARMDKIVIDDWRKRMVAANVPNDLLDRTLWASNRVYELSTYDMQRAGCVTE